MKRTRMGRDNSRENFKEKLKLLVWLGVINSEELRRDIARKVVMTAKVRLPKVSAGQPRAVSVEHR